MTADPPFDTGATHVRRTWPDTFVGVAAGERGAEGTVRGIALTMALAALLPAAFLANTRK